MALSKIQTGLLADGSVDTTQLAADAVDNTILDLADNYKFAGAQIEYLNKLDWMRVAFIQRRNLSGEWESFLLKEKKAILEGDRLIVFTDHSRANSVQKKI